VVNFFGEKRTAFQRQYKIDCRNWFK